MKLHEDKTLFTQLLNFSANTLNIRPEFVEKDYWLTCALQRMAQNENAEKVVFKGGTRMTIELIGLWETLYNPNFKHIEFDVFRNQAGLKLNQIAIQQMSVLQEVENRKMLK